MDQNIYNQHNDNEWGDVLCPPHGSTQATVKIKYLLNEDPHVQCLMIGNLKLCISCYNYSDILTDRLPNVPSVVLYLSNENYANVKIWLIALVIDYLKYTKKKKKKKKKKSKNFSLKTI